MGHEWYRKPSLIKTIHATLCQDRTLPNPLKLVEIYHEDLAILPILIDFLKNQKAHFVVFYDDLSFDHNITSYTPLRAAIDSSFDERP
ncbi:DUF815 domain-containing protein [Bartonella sp. DGB2]|uniref:DUF815 domain-containing protein n=1 Tax=Bartonella sp. DGB2 TaxID=3388426 RepID=UPI00398FA172